MTTDDWRAVHRMIDDGCPHGHPDHEPHGPVPPGDHSRAAVANAEVLSVTDVRGRFPSRPRALRHEDIEITVTEWSPGTLTVRLDSRTDAEFWLELTLTLCDGS